jgi:predicted AlkP superfamily phosphohydrolase/phosphomutase
MPVSALPAALSRVLLIGWDAADWKVIQPLLESGHMPHLRALIERGVMGNLATLQPVLSPMLWTSIGTGQRPYKHGILGFSEVDPQTGNVRPVTATSRKVKAIWNILHQTGRTCHVIGWWPSFPVEPLRGVMVSNHYHRAVAALGQPWPLGLGHIHPPSAADELCPLRVHPHELEGDMLRHFVPRAPEIDQTQDKRLQTLAKLFSEVVNVQAAATHVLQTRPDWDFAAVYFDAIDHFSHAFMRYHPPRLDWVSEHDFALYQDVIKAAYVFHDTMLGAQIQLAGPDATVVVMSDHGFHSDGLRPKNLPNEPAGPAAEHRPFGIFVAAGPGIRPDSVVHGATVLDIVPTLLAHFGLPIGRDLDGRVLEEIFLTPPRIEYVDTWETVPGDAARLSNEAHLDSASASEQIKQLADLGYIEPLPADRQQAADQTIKEERYNLARALAHGGRAAQAAAVFQESWDRWPEESRFGVQLLQLQTEQNWLLEARATFDLLKIRKEAAMTAAAAELKTLLEDLHQRQASAPSGDAPPPAEPAKLDLAKLDENDFRRLRRLRSRAAINLPALAFLEGSLLAAEGRPAAALAALEKSTAAQASQQPALALKRAQLHLALRDRPAARAAYERALALDPINPAPHLGLARVALAEKNHAAAAASADSALSLNHALPQAHLVAALARWRLRELDTTERHLRAAAALAPENAATHRLLATFALRERGDRSAHFEHRAAAARARRQRRESHAGLPASTSLPLPSPAAQLNLPPLAAPPANADAVSLASSIVVVTGLPRSGTSMAMQMLAAGGIPILTDDLRAPDESNPRGYLEYTPAKRLASDNSWVPGCAGQAVKLISQLLPFLPEGPKYRIVNMRRPVAAVVASQRAMLDRDGKAGAGATPAKLAAIFQTQLMAAHTRLEHLRRTGEADVLHLDYDRAISHPAETAQKLAAFLGPQFDAAAAAAAIDPALRRTQA